MGSSELEPRSEALVKVLVEAEQGVRIQTLGAQLAQDVTGLCQAIGTQDRSLGMTPHEQVLIVAIVIVEVRGLAGAFPRGAERNFAQSSNL